MPPTFGNGKICYVEIPATDIARSADFYQRVFGWKIRTNKEGDASFDDGVGEVSGRWVLGRPAHTAPVLMVHVMVDNADAPEITAHFRDPGGNVIGLYQHGGSR
jgi:predicted enzyme related to lactoylglutathione lyase